MRWFGKSHEATEHAYALERLSLYLDGELAPREKGRLDEHLATCRACRWEFDTLRRTVQWTMELPRVPVPRAFVIPVPARPVRAVSRPWALPVLQGATALVAVLFLVAVLGQVALPRLFPAAGPQPAALQSGAAATAVPEADLSQQVVEATVAVEAAIAAASPTLQEMGEQPATLKAMPPAATAVVSTTMIVQETQPPSAPGVGGGQAEGEPAIATQMAEVAAMTAAPAGMGVAAAPPPAAASATPSPTPTETPQPSPTPWPTDTPSPSPEPSLEREVLEPTAVALVPEAVPPGASLPVASDNSEAVRRSVAGGLATAQIVLGATFVVLGLATAVLMARRLRKS